MAGSIYFIEHLSRSDRELLTQLLSRSPELLPTREWLRDQSICMSTFPSRLLKPTFIIPRLVMALPFTAQNAILCHTHKTLNPQLIHRIFLEVCAEASINLSTLVENPNLRPNVSAFVQRMQKLNSLWMSTELYRTAFQAMPNDPRFDRIPNGCEACIISAVGGSDRIISDLRAAMMGRRKRRQPRPTLTRLVDAWIDWTGRGSFIREESYTLGREIGRCRRGMQRARRARQNAIPEEVAQSETLVDNELDNIQQDQDQERYVYEPRTEQDQHDFEGSIIDFYANLMSTTNLSPNSAAASVMEGSIHPAFSSVVFLPETGTFLRHPPPRTHVPHPPQAYTNNSRDANPTATAYSESVYSTQEDERCRSPSQRNVDVHEAYRTLTGRGEGEGEPEPEPEPARSRISRDWEAVDRTTRWSNFQKW